MDSTILEILAILFDLHSQVNWCYLYVEEIGLHIL